MTNIYDMADTWNNGGTTFTAIKMNVTDTASASGSLLMDLQVGGALRFRVRKDGAIFFDNGSGGASCLLPDSNNVGIGDGGQARLAVNSNAAVPSIVVQGNYALGWASGVPGSIDTALFRDDAADIIAQRRGTNAQVTRGYRTFTDASNYERWALQSGAGYFELAAETAGTGTDDIDLRVTPAGNGRVDFRNADDAAAAQTGTLLNAPTAGNPTFWLTVKVNGTALAIPAWALP